MENYSWLNFSYKNVIFSSFKFWNKIEKLCVNKNLENKKCLEIIF